ncbi:MAG: adenylylsulfate reductase subunit alpha, partial [Pseudomonadota bacterium]
DELEKRAPYGTVKPIPACLRNHLGMLDLFGGKGPIYMQTADAIKRIVDAAPDEKAKKKALKELESEAWEDFLDMTISQAILWAGTNLEPDKKPSEIAPCEPYFIGSHSGASGAWVSGPEDIAPPEYNWGYCNMSTVKGLFCGGDASGASSHKFSSGSHAEGRIAAKSAIRFIVENSAQPKVDAAQVEALKARILRPLDLFKEHSALSSDPNINPNFIKPKDFMFRLQKIMDEYAGGVSMHFTTNGPLLEKGMELLGYLKEDADKLAAEDLHELMRCWENVHRMWQAESHVRTLMFRKETRWPGYYYRADFPDMDEKNWHVFANCKWDPKTGEWTMMKREILSLKK